MRAECRFLPSTQLESAHQHIVEMSHHVASVLSLDIDRYCGQDQAREVADCEMVRTRRTPMANSIGVSNVMKRRRMLMIRSTNGH